MSDSDKKRAKFCPFLKSWCDKDEQARCAMWMELHRTHTSPVGARQIENVGMCAIPALCELISQLAKPQAPQQVIKLPPQILRG